MQENTEKEALYLQILEKRSAAIPLLTQRGYFARYREHRADGVSCRIAWLRTEGQLVEALGFRRFSDFKQFQNELRWERKRLLRTSVRIVESHELPV